MTGVQTCALPICAETEAATIPVAKRLGELTETDPVWSPAQAPRLPGTLNWKIRTAPTRVQVVEFSGRRYSLEELRTRVGQVFSPTKQVELTPLPADPGFPDPLTPFVVAGLQLPPRLNRVFESYAWVGDRSRADAALAVWAAEQGWANTQIAALLVTPRGAKAVDRYRKCGREPAIDYLAKTIAWARRKTQKPEEVVADAE